MPKQLLVRISNVEIETNVGSITSLVGVDSSIASIWVGVGGGRGSGDTGRVWGSERG